MVRLPMPVLPQLGSLALISLASTPGLTQGTGELPWFRLSNSGQPQSNLCWG